MRELRVTVWVSILLLLCFQGAVRGESPATPISAKQRQLVYQIQPDGSKVLKRQEVGMFYRSSSGAVMNTMGQFSAFIDAQGDAYEINHLIKKAWFVERQELPHLRKLQGIKSYEKVNGFDCAIRTIQVNGKPGGQSCWSEPYAVMIKSDWTSSDTQTVREIYEVTFAEPDPSLFRIPEGYSISNQPDQ